MTTTAASGRRYRLLVVEDDCVDREAIERMLRIRACGEYDLSFAGTLAEGLARTENDVFDAAILDLKLPDTTGLSGLESLLQAGHGLPVIVCSGESDHNLALRAVQRGAQDYLLKGHFDSVVLQRALCYAIERKRTEQAVQHLAYYDNLTGVPNRLLLADRIDQQIQQARRKGRCFAILYLDLDGFKQVNDQCGHAAGDAVLREFASRLQSCVRGSDTVARLGGDEFAVLIGDLAASPDAAVAARKVLASMETPFRVGGQTLHASTSVGIAVWPSDGATGEALIQAADRAMYRAKQEGTGEFRFSSPDVAQVSERGTRLASELRRALNGEELRLRFVPQLDLRAGRIAAVQARSCLDRADGSTVPYVSIGEIAERTDLMLPLAEWTVQRIGERGDLWRGAGEGVRVDIQLARGHVNEPRFVGKIASAMDAAGLEPRRLGVEVTEHAISRNESRALATLCALRDLHVHVTLAEFGTGDTSLRTLGNLPVDTLKLDPSLLADIPRSERSAELVHGIVSVAHAMDKKVVADGVSCEAQLDVLAGLGCDHVAGPSIGESMEDDALRAFLNRGMLSGAVARRRRQGGLRCSSS